MDVEGCRRLSVHDGFIERCVGLFFVCASWVVRLLAGEVNVSWVVVVSASASALGHRKVCVEVA